MVCFGVCFLFDYELCGCVDYVCYVRVATLEMYVSGGDDVCAWVLCDCACVGVCL